jgi:hypothetical protein
MEAVALAAIPGVASVAGEARSPEAMAGEALKVASMVVVGYRSMQRLRSWWDGYQGSD